MVDHEARQDVAVTMQKLADHEKQCGERWGVITKIGLLQLSALLTGVGALIVWLVTN